MKKFLTLVLIASLSLFSCTNYNTTPEDVEETPSYYMGVTEISVPTGTKSVYVYNGNNVQEVSVNPIISEPEHGFAPEPWGLVHLEFESSIPTSVSVSYKCNDIEFFCLKDFPVRDGIVTKALTDPIKLEEPAPYTTEAGGRTLYHSSGVVMFEDSWPTSNRTASGAYDTDFNDCIVDFDLETSVVPDDMLEPEGWREQVKVVLQVRVVGGPDPYRVGLILEGFDMNNVESIEEHKTLDSYNNPHGTLPDWTKVTLQENSLHYDPLNSAYASNNPTRPCLEIGAMFRLNDANRGAGTEEYTYTNNGQSHQTVFNPSLNAYWAAPKTEQYCEELADLYKTNSRYTLDYVQGQKLYNAIPGYINVSGGLYTYTVIYHMKPRAEMTAEERNAVKQNMIDVVNKTERENFYIVNKNYRPVHLSGYRPADFKVKDYNSYAAKYEEIFAQNTDKLDPEVPYLSKDGLVWGVKCPVLTKHVWNKLNFSDAYPKYMNWVDSNGEEDRDWYETSDGRFISCWW